MAYTINYYGTPKYNVSSRKRTAADIKYIVVHYTGSGTASTKNIAKNNCIYFNGGNRSASADYFIDNSSIWCFNNKPFTYYTWHCGDGHGAYGITNANSVGIEVASNGADFTSEEIARLTFLVKKLMKDYGIDAKHVVRHYDASRKQCPYMYCGTSAKDAKWKTLHAKITGTATTTTSTKTTSTTSTCTIKTTAKSGLRIRKTKSATAAVLGVIPNNTKIKGAVKSGNWYKITYKGTTGYISSTYAQKI